MSRLRFPIPAALTVAILLLGCGGQDSGATDDDAGALAAFREYRRAMDEGDFELLKSCLTAEKAEELEGQDPKQVLAMLAMFRPSGEEVDGVEVRGDSAVVRLVANQDGNAVGGRVRMVRADGRWQVAKEEWQFGDGALDGSGFEEDEPSVAEPPPPPPPPAEGEYRFDLAGRAIPDRPASGRLAGEPFAVRKATIQNDILTLADGDFMDRTGSFTVFLFPRGEASTRNVAIEYGPEMDMDAPVGAHVHVQHQGEDGNFVTDAKAEGFALRLLLGEENDGKLEGRIWVCFPDEGKSYLAGRFTAEVE